MVNYNNCPVKRPFQVSFKFNLPRPPLVRCDVSNNAIDVDVLPKYCKALCFAFELVYYAVLIDTRKERGST